MRENGGTRLLEIGAGTGQDSLFFQRNGLDVVAVDLAPAMVARCRHRRPGDGLPAAGPPPESFDAVYALNCLLHVPNTDLPDVQSAIRALLRPTGLFFLGVYGGAQEEGIAEQIQRFAAPYFEIVDFHVVDTERIHFQSLALRRPG